MDQDFQKDIDNCVSSVLDIMERRVSQGDLQRIKDAYEFAALAHSGQKRKSGEPYIIHPVSVALIVASEMGLGANPVIAAFLHDVVEDTPYGIEDIRERFGDDVAFLVEVVTKKKKDSYYQSKQVDNFRQILESVCFDIRALLLKLADRIHNMRTLDSMRPDKQMKIAGETDYFYAPIANRLGMYQIKTELENLSFRYRCPYEYSVLEKQLSQTKIRCNEYLNQFTAKIQQILDDKGICARTEIRYRMPYSIWRKMQAAGCDFFHADGKHYIRIVFPDNTGMSEKSMSLHIYSILTDVFKEKPGSVSNYINAPKENGYQSFHVKLLNDMGGWEEIHISSERMVRNSVMGCTAERTEENVMVWLEKFRYVLSDLARNNDGMEFMEGVTSSFYNDDIMVFTPKGQGIILPKGAIALDFAFEIHSDVGLKAKYARINGRLSSVKTRLHRGDCVEIGTQQDSEPKEDWINHVMTYKAKRSLSLYESKRKKLEFDRCTECHPLPGDEVIGFRDKNGGITIHRRNCQSAISLASRHGDSILSMDFEVNESMLYPVRISVRGIDRYHLLAELTDCITNQKLSITKLTTDIDDYIAVCNIDFGVHSANELQNAIDAIAAIPGIDEVRRINIE